MRERRRPRQKATPSPVARRAVMPATIADRAQTTGGLGRVKFPLRLKAFWRTACFHGQLYWLTHGLHQLDRLDQCRHEQNQMKNYDDIMRAASLLITHITPRLHYARYILI